MTPILRRGVLYAQATGEIQCNINIQYIYHTYIHHILNSLNARGEVQRSSTFNGPQRRPATPDPSSKVSENLSQETIICIHSHAPAPRFHHTHTSAIPQLEEHTHNTTPAAASQPWRPSTASPSPPPSSHTYTPLYLQHPRSGRTAAHRHSSGR